MHRQHADSRQQHRFPSQGRASDAKIREAYPDLTPAQIHAALAYYYDNREEIDAELNEDGAWAESLDR